MYKRLFFCIVSCYNFIQNNVEKNIIKVVDKEENAD